MKPLDLSPKMIERAKAQAGDSESYFVASAQELPFQDASFDKILSVESLYYYEDPFVALQEWYRIARPGAQIGILIDLFQENDGSHSWVDALSIPVHLLSIDEYISLLERAGWSQCSHQFFHDHRPRKKEEDFHADAYWPSYAHYLRFKEVGSLALSATKN